MAIEALREKSLTCDVAVIGGGLAGMIAAISAARHGAKVALVQDRPVLGGNASSEIRMWVGGCRGKNNRETGILEEIMLENMYRNEYKNFHIWDSVLYEKVRYEENIDLYLNCTCCGATMDGSKVKSIRAWQLTTYTWFNIEAKVFIDCSGDSILAPITGAEYRCGREAESEFGESIGHEFADRKTMGLSCMIQARDTGRPVKFTPPDWAHKYPDESAFVNRDHDLSEVLSNNWWMEIGGDHEDSLYDTEELRDELLRIAIGLWDHIKNYGDHHAENWELDWIGFLPGKRESRRYVGDHIMTQNDVLAEGRFDDLVAYGGWPMDDHDPRGFYNNDHPNVNHPCPYPYGIPFRSLYSKNIDNLMFAGRNISVTHAALSSTRVMATCSVIGQAAGTGASLAVKYGISPRGVYRDHIRELQATLMNDDCWLPWHERETSELTKSAHLTAECADPSILYSGIERPIGKDYNGVSVPLNSAVTYTFDSVKHVESARVVFDSDLNRETVKSDSLIREFNMPCNRTFEFGPFNFPTTVVRSFKVEILTSDNEWKTVFETANNRRRLVLMPINADAKAVRLIPLATWGDDEAKIFSFDIQ